MLTQYFVIKNLVDQYISSSWYFMVSFTLSMLPFRNDYAKFEY